MQAKYDGVITIGSTVSDPYDHYGRVFGLLDNTFGVRNGATRATFDP